MGRKSGPRGCLLFPGYPPEIFFGQLEEGFKLAHPVFADIPGTPRRACLVQEPDGFFMVGFSDVKGVFESGLMLEG